MYVNKRIWKATDKNLKELSALAEKAYGHPVSEMQLMQDAVCLELDRVKRQLKRRESK